MRRLINLIYKYHLFLLFLLLELLGFILLLNNRYQRAAIVNSTNAVTGGYFSAIENMQEYLNLKQENDKLQKENAKLRSTILNFPVLEENLRFFEIDTNVVIIPAKIISGQISNNHNYFMINKGSKDGIRPDMGVISEDVVVGITTRVSTAYSLLLPVINVNSKISAKIKKNNYKASLIWDGVDYRYAKLIDIPNHLELFPGDTIVTSGYSFYFPPGLLLGTVSEYYHDEGANFNHAKVKLFADFDALQNVYLIDNYHQNQQDSLLNSATHE